MSGHSHSGGDLIADRYRIEGFIAEGGMQQVYRAVDLAIDRIVVVKTPKNPSAEKRFKRSAQMSARVTHPNIAKTLDFLPLDGREYLIEEYIDGTNLQHRLDVDFHLLDPHLGAHLFHHLSKAVAASHRAQVVHRDLKPSNIMVSGDPGLTQIKITDFGIAKMAETEIDEAVREGEESITASATVVGALPYMAPEVIEDNKNVGPACDVWAVGAIVYYALTGSKPFGSGLPSIPKILSGQFKPLGDYLHPKPQFQALVHELEELLGRCLDVNPSNRIGSEELVSSISNICYSTAPRLTGEIYNYGVGSGKWGFISSVGHEDCFFHLDSFYGSQPKNGQKVNFSSFPGEPTPRAFPVLPLR
jgi:eukaryotic-like serine/threonine-protein kinase